MANTILALVDYKHQLYCPFKGTNTAMNLDWTRDLFADLGYDFQVMSFKDVDFRTQDYKNTWVIYQSSQDRNLLYKNYIDDVMLGLEWAGARLIPDYRQFRAHHNKVFMEMYRDLHPDQAIKGIQSRHFGCLEEFLEAIPSLNYPVIIKAAAGDQSKGVELIRHAGEAEAKARKISACSSVWEDFPSLGSDKPACESQNRRKFIVQTFIDGLDRDYKIVVFGDKYFVLMRPCAEGDFRASGTAIPRSFAEELPPGLLDYAKSVFDGFNAPFASLDFFYNGKEFFLGEFQFLRFGAGSLINSTHHFIKQDGQWKAIAGRSRWEPQFVQAIHRYIQRREADCKSKTERQAS